MLPGLYMLDVVIFVKKYPNFFEKAGDNSRMGLRVPTRLLLPPSQSTLFEKKKKLFHNV